MKTIFHFQGSSFFYQPKGTEAGSDSFSDMESSGNEYNITEYEREVLEDQALALGFHIDKNLIRL